MKFNSYNGWANYPTWHTYTVLTSYEPTREDFEEYARMTTNSSDQLEAVRNIKNQFVIGLDEWKIRLFPPRHGEAMQANTLGCLLDVVDQTNWRGILHVLQDQSLEMDAFDQAGLTFLRSSEAWVPHIGETSLKPSAPAKSVEEKLWNEVQGIVSDEVHDRLHTWVTDQVWTWVQSPDARKYRGTPLCVYAEEILNRCIEVIDWEEVTKVLRGE